MKRNMISFFLIVCSIFVANGQAYIEPASVNFNVTAQKEVEADTLVINIQLEKKDKNFKTVSSDISKLMEQTIGNLKKAGLKDENIIVDKLNSYPDVKWWNGKEYVIKTLIKAKIRDKNLFSAVFSSIPATDPAITMTGIEYEFSNIEEIRTALIEQGAKIADEQKKAYEKNFGIKLTVQAINVTEDLGENGRPIYRAAGAKMMKDSAALYSNETAASSVEFEKLPIREMKMMFYLRYNIIK